MRLSRTKRKKGGLAFQLTERDLEIIRAVNRYRYLRTNQIQRLIFTENTSIQSARNRLKVLFHNNYLGRIEPFVQFHNQKKEMTNDLAYYLGRAGHSLLEEIGEAVYRYSKANQVQHQFLLHALELSEFRLHLEQAIDQNDNLLIDRFIAYFEMKEHLTGLSGKHRYRLYDEIRNPLSGDKITVYPDATTILEAPEFGQKRLFFVEIDRGTEGLERIREKILGYHWYAKNRIFAKFGPFEKFTVLFQTSSEIRARNMAALVGSMICDPEILVTDFTKLNAKTLLENKIWLDKASELKSLLKN